MFFDIFSPYEHILAALENKKPTFFACIPEQVYATIFESSKNNNFCQNHQI